LDELAYGSVRIQGLNSKDVLRNANGRYAKSCRFQNLAPAYLYRHNHLLFTGSSSVGLFSSLNIQRNDRQLKLIRSPSEPLPRLIRECGSAAAENVLRSHTAARYNYMRLYATQGSEGCFVSPETMLGGK
jgi:hypothetical protein